MSSHDEDITPSEFVKKIRELGDKRDKEDAERFALLEQQIYRDREERAARRAERARSISPEKSKTSTPGSLRTLNTPSPSPSPDVASPSTAMADLAQTPASLARSGTLSWQQRPKSSSGRRPLSQLAAENAARSPRTAATEPTEDATEPSRAQIAESLLSKDPSWFRQTADRGLGSAAYRKTQVEDSSPVITSTLNKQHLPGMAVSSSKSPGPSIAPPPSDHGRSPSPIRPEVSTAGWDNKFVLSPTGPAVGKSLDPPKLLSSAESPSGARSLSPTKGMGGFVQSAMMKRTDSVSKRWSAQGGPGLSRQSSTASNRSSWREGKAGESTSMPRLDLATREPSTEPIERPKSAQGNKSPATLKVVEHIDRDGFAKPSLPLHARSRSTVSVRSNHGSDSIDAAQPPSPSKRWSPTKSSWLESALSKNEDKPKPQQPPAQPSWMTEMNKAKQQRASAEALKGAAADNVAGAIDNNPISQAQATKTETKPKPLRPEPGHKPPTLHKELSAPATLPSTLRSERSPTINSKPPIAAKPSIPPATDFRSNLKPRQQASDGSSSEKPEFLNAFGNLRRTTTENYVAPDTLKNNITAGKAALTVTGGPAKRDRVDEFKESLLKQKETIKTKAITEAPKKPAEKPPALSATPEALTRRLQMNKTGGEFKDPLKERKTQEADVPKFLTRQKTGDFKDPLKERKAKESAVPAFLTRQKTGDFKDPLKEKKVQRADVPEFLARQRTIIDKPKPDIPHKSVVSTRNTPEKAMQDAPAERPWTESEDKFVKSKSEPVPAASREPSDNPPATTSLFAGGLKSGASSKLAGRFNPALVGILARGPTSAAPSSSLTQKPEASPSLASISRTESETQSGSAELTHMTKGRARGPKRKAPTSKAVSTASKAEVEVKPVTPSEKHPQSRVGPQAAERAAFSTPVKSSIVASVPLVKPKDVLPSSPISAKRPEVTRLAPKPEVMKDKPLTPSKSPNLSQRTVSQNLETASMRTVDEVKSVDSISSIDRTVMTANKPATPSKPIISGVPTEADRNIISSLNTKPFRALSPKPNLPVAQKPASLDWTKSQASEKSAVSNFTPPLSAEPTKTEVSSLWSAPSASAAVTSTTSLSSQPIFKRVASPQPSRSPPREEDDLSSVSVKSAMATWGRAPEPSSRGRAKSPVKLPTRHDEDERMREAGLLPSNGAGLGLGLGLDKPAVVSNSRSPFPLSPPLTAGLPPTADNSAANINPAFGFSAVNDRTSDRPRQISARLQLQTGSIGPKPRPLSITLNAPPDSPIPQTTEASNLFADFFDEKPVASTPRPDLNIMSVLESGAVNADKVRTNSKTMSEILSDGNLKTVLPHQEHILFDESMYVCVHNHNTVEGNQAVETYLWIGNGIPAAYVEGALSTARKIAQQHHSKLQVVRQGKEPPLLFQALGGIVTTFRGPRRTTTSGLPRTFMLCIRRHNGHIAFDEVDFGLDTICSGFAYIVCSNSRLFLWKGRGSHAEELGCARLIAMDLGTTSEIIEVEEGQEPPAFFRVFPAATIASPSLNSSGIPRSADHWRLKPACEKYKCRLFRVLDPHNPISPTATSPTESTKERASMPSVNSFLSGLSSAAQGLRRKGSWSSVLPISTSNSPTRSRPETPVSPMPRSANPFAASSIFASFGRRDSDVETTKLPPEGPIREVVPFCQRDLHPEGIYVLDAFFEIYVIVGSSAHAQANAFTTALIFAQDYGITAASLQDRPFVPISTVVLEGAPRDMKVCFRGWSDELAARPRTEDIMRGRARKEAGGVRVVGLAAALAATRGP